MFERIGGTGHESVMFCQDPSVGLKAVIAVHSTVLGPAIGGCRMWSYDSHEAAVADALRLSEAMTYKCAAAGLNIGGGKSVIIGDPKKKTDELFQSFARFVARLGGCYYVGEDVGTTQHEMDLIIEAGGYAVCASPDKGGTGDPSFATAFGVYRAIKACLKEAYGDDTAAGKRVVLQGLGNVGRGLARYLGEEGAELVVTDIEPAKVQRIVEQHGATAVAPEEVFDVPCDVFAPCALGGAINEDTVERLRCRIVCGAANNQLATPAVGDRLYRRGILYGPDYVANAGGVTQAAGEVQGFTREQAWEMVERIYDRMLNIFRLAEAEGVPPWRAADLLAERRVAEAAGQRAGQGAAD